MYKLCKTEQSVKRQLSIEEALFKKLQSKPFEDITITELCEKIEIPRKAFYRYFDTIDDALQAMIFHNLCEYKGSAEDVCGGGTSTIVCEIENFFVFWKSKKLLLDVLKKNGMLSLIMDAVINFPINDFTSIQKFLPDDNELMRTRIFKFALSGLVSIMIEWYYDGFIDSEKDMATLALRLLSHPLFPFIDEKLF